MHGAAAPFGPRSPSKGASVLIYPSLVSILVFLRPVMVLYRLCFTFTFANVIT